MFREKSWEKLFHLETKSNDREQIEKSLIMRKIPLKFLKTLCTFGNFDSIIFWGI